MIVETFFHLDCNPVIPECGYQCSRCIAEIRSVLGSCRGVSEVALGKRSGASGILVKHDAAAISAEELLTAFGSLPSFYRGRFVPQVLHA
jgi:hypothetical protein